jgi:hypothetical protein
LFCSFFVQNSSKDDTDLARIRPPLPVDVKLDALNLKERKKKTLGTAASLLKSFE